MIKNFLDLIKISKSSYKSLMTKGNKILLENIMNYHKIVTFKVKKYKNYFYLMSLLISIIYISLGILSIFYLKQRIEISFIFLGLIFLTLIINIFICYNKDITLKSLKIFTFIHIIMFILIINTFIFLMQFYENYEKNQTDAITSLLMILANLLTDIIFFEINKIYSISFFMVYKIIQFSLNIFYIYSMNFIIIILLLCINIQIFLKGVMYLIELNSAKKAKFILKIFINDLMNLFNDTLSQFGIIHILLKDNNIFYSNLFKYNEDIKKDNNNNENENFFLKLVTNANSNNKIIEEIKKPEVENININKNENNNNCNNNNHTNNLEVIESNRKKF